MTAFGQASPQTLMMNKIMPPRGSYIYSGGYRDSDKGYVKYGAPSSDYPTLLLVNPIYDNDGNSIAPGYYELSLDSERTMFSLKQSGNIIARIPVFKIEEDKTQEQAPQPMSYKAQRKADKEQKKKDKLRKKQILQGVIPDDTQQIYNNATIEHVDDNGGYYLIKYERGMIRAWGVVK